MPSLPMNQIFPFDLPVLYEDEHIIVVDKPHFLPTMPRGMWYKSTALMRLRDIFGEDDIVPAHRLDRLTAGIVVLCAMLKHAVNISYSSKIKSKKSV